MNKYNKKILIAEDETPMLNALAKKFSDSGFNVLEAENGEKGLELALKEKPHIMILDIIMPKMDGLTVAMKVREDQRWGASVPIIMLTNLSDADQVAEAARFDIYDFLVKTDWRLDDIVELVKKRLFLK